MNILFLWKVCGDIIYEGKEKINATMWNLLRGQYGLDEYCFNWHNRHISKSSSSVSDEAEIIPTTSSVLTINEVLLFPDQGRNVDQKSQRLRENMIKEYDNQ